jgi:hypothetical protein
MPEDRPLLGKRWHFLPDQMRQHIAVSTGTLLMMDR